MKLTVVVDNNTLIDSYYLGEPGTAYYIEDGNNKILFDTGYSDIIINNANKMNISLTELDYIVLSHGHNDHTRGLNHIISLMKSSVNRNHKDTILLAHPSALNPKICDNEEIGIALSQNELKKYFDMKLSESPVWISEKLVFLGQIERVTEFENLEPIGFTSNNGIEEADYLLDDSAIVYKSELGLIIITGCSHAGICNIVQYAKKVCQDERVFDIIGGFHLLNPSEEQIGGTLEYMKLLQPEQVHTCHCTDLYSKIELSKVVKIKEVGVGLTLEFE